MPILFNDMSGITVSQNATETWGFAVPCAARQPAVRGAACGLVWLA